MDRSLGFRPCVEDSACCARVGLALRLVVLGVDAVCGEEMQAVVVLSRLLLSRLAPSVTKHEVTEYFSKFGELAKGKVVLDENGFGFVTFTSSLAVQK